MPRVRLNHTRGSQLCHSFFFLFSGLRFPEALSGSRIAELTMQQPGKQKSYVECLGGLYNEQYTCFTYHPTARSWRGTCQIVPSLAYRTICIVLLSLQYLLNKQYMASAYYCIPFFHKCSSMTCCTRTILCGQYTRGLSTPKYGVISPNTLTSATP